MVEMNIIIGTIICVVSLTVLIIKIKKDIPHWKKAFKNDSD